MRHDDIVVRHMQEVQLWLNLREFEKCLLVSLLCAPRAVVRLLSYQPLVVEFTR